MTRLTWNSLIRPHEHLEWQDTFWSNFFPTPWVCKCLFLVYLHHYRLNRERESVANIKWLTVEQSRFMEFKFFLLCGFQDFFPHPRLHYKGITIITRWWVRSRMIKLSFAAFSHKKLGLLLKRKKMGNIFCSSSNRRLCEILKLITRQEVDQMNVSFWKTRKTTVF